MRERPYTRRRRSKTLAVLLAAGLVGVAGTVAFSSMAPSSATADSAPRAAVEDANIVFILTDDLSKNLVPYMSTVRAMKNRGTTFSNYFASDSLCCPSRSNILTGLYPHNTHVLVNEGDRDIPGGYRAFQDYENQRRTYAVALRDEYRTGFMGKYLNGYKIREHPVPPGWDEWHVTANGYQNMPKTYNITKVEERGDDTPPSKPDDYLTDLLGKRARGFVNRAHANGQPFFLQLSTFAPHQRTDGNKPVFPAAMRDRPGRKYVNGDCGTKPGGGRYNCNDLHVKRSGDFTDGEYDKLDRQYRDRVRMVQSLNDQIVKLREQLRANGQLDNTYFVFASDNGYHLGQHGLYRGKGSPYDHDTQVPLVIEGPGVQQNKVRGHITQTVDLYATFQQMANQDPKPSNGHGLLNILEGDQPTDWRNAALYEHKPQLNKSTVAEDPDIESDVVSPRIAFNPAYQAYKAIRTENWLYVRYKDRKDHLYDLRSQDGDNKNVIDGHPSKADYLEGWLTRYANCGKPDRPTCWSASHAPPA